MGVCAGRARGCVTADGRAKTGARTAAGNVVMRAGAGAGSNSAETGVFVSGAAQSSAACSHGTAEAVPETAGSGQDDIGMSQTGAAITHGITAALSHKPRITPSNNFACVLVRFLIIRRMSEL